MSEPIPKKSLGQHWLMDETALAAIADAAELTPDDTVLEVGPGLGPLTQLLTERAGQVVAVEFDEALAAELPRRVPTPNLKVIRQDILSFDFTSLPPDYKVVANIPYYLTSNFIRVLSETTNRPSVAVLLVQQEVAERVTASPGDMSVLSVTAQYYWRVGLGFRVPAELFTPPPKVDSQVLLLERRDEELFPGTDTKQFFRLVKAGFSERRKKLRSSLSNGMHVSKPDAEAILNKASIDPNLRAQALSLDDWHRLYVANT
ncbi:MAG TPA: 16S rRNA (adenine(1518)-N(6)/adenine(1519)-N(6))-dimethyltransferase RsmA [Candidatus Saccharimonadales bacterium]|nr:16S rRNA (adenine(1518)-N(6)/adenine(1519)-N(6))-dimethyltransferase RsmA [Candidatus Saccharimonadales bacterium]